jgi:hypothetical protein
MKKYQIEGGINFFDELYKSLDIQENDNKCDEDNNKCLITNEILIDKSFEMSCGHKFNYIALYNDLLNHKKKFNLMESSTGHLKINEIRCPYCRQKHVGLLPYYEDLNLKKEHGVNYIDLNKTYTPAYVGNSYKPCESLVINLNYDPSGNGTDELIQCMAYGTKLPQHYGDTKHYCCLHKKLIINKHKRDECQKLKAEKQKAKDIFIAEVKKAKEETTQKLKEEKQKTKEEKQKTKEEKQKTQKLKDELANLVKEEKQKTQTLKDELTTLVKDSKTKKKVKKVTGLSTETDNVVIEVNLDSHCSETTNNKGCIQILKTGINKGTKCGCKVYNGEYCKRHHKISINEV